MGEGWGGGRKGQRPGPGATGAWVGSFFSGVTPPPGLSSRTARGAGGGGRFWDLCRSYQCTGSGSSRNIWVSIQA